MGVRKGENKRKLIFPEICIPCKISRLNFLLYNKIYTQYKKRYLHIKFFGILRRLADVVVCFFLSKIAIKIEILYFEYKMFPSYFLDFIENNKVKNKKESLIYSPKMSDCHLYFDFFSTKTIISIDSKDLEYNKFYNMLWDLYLSNYTYCFCEKQDIEQIVTHSGIRVDIDAYHENPQNINKADESLYTICIRKLLKLLYKFLNIPDGYETYIAVLINEKPYLHNGFYKEGFHIVVPGIKINKAAKINILKMYSENIQKEFIAQGFMDKPVIDPSSSTSPIELYGSIREEKKTSHIINGLYKVKFSNICTINKLFDDQYKYTKKKDKINQYSNCNLILELSIHYAGKLIKKDEFELKNEYNVIDTGMNKNIELDEDKLEREVNILIEGDYRAREVYNYMAILNPSRGMGGQYNDWIRVITTIMNINYKYKNIAKLFSIKCDKNSWNKGGISILENLYKDARDTQDNSVTDEKRNINLAVLKNMAKQDNIEKYSEINNKILKNRIFNVIVKSDVLTHDMIADWVYSTVYEKLKFISVPMSGFGYENGYWLEFITPERVKLPENIRPFIYKWYKHDNCPDEIDNCITQTISKQAKTLQYQYQEDLQKEIDKDRKEQFSTYIKNAKNIIKMCGTDGAITSIKNRCKASWFKDDFMLNELDKYNNILGVGNGILVFNETAEFISRSHNYKITRTTDTIYTPYDKNNKYIKKVEKILSEIISDEKKRIGLLMHISLCFVKSKPDRYFNIFWSGGASGKTILMQFIENALGAVANSGYGANFGYYDTMDANVFTSEKRDINGVDHHLKKIENARFIQCPEGKGGIIHTHVFKSIRDGVALRGLYKETKNVKFEGIIAYVTNHKVKFENFNYALCRRILYHHFTSKFVPNPKEKNERKENTKYKEKSLKNKEWGAAFLSILVEHWNMFNKSYKGEAHLIYTESGLEQETNEFLNTQNHMLQFINTMVKINVESEKIKIIDFCVEFIRWYKKTMQIKYEIPASDFVDEAKYMLPNNIVIEDKIEYFDKISIDYN